MAIIYKKIKKLSQIVESYFLGQKPHPTAAQEPYSHLILNQSEYDDKVLRFLLANYVSPFQQLGLVILWPFYEAFLLKGLKGLLPEHTYVVLPQNVDDINCIIKSLADEVPDIVVVAMNLSALPSKVEQVSSYKTLISSHDFTGFVVDFYQDLHHLCVSCGYSLVVVEDRAHLSERKSAFLRRLFPRNTVFQE